jgi:hypothetical protein
MPPGVEEAILCVDFVVPKAERSGSQLLTYVVLTLIFVAADHLGILKASLLVVEKKGQEYQAETEDLRAFLLPFHGREPMKRTQAWTKQRQGTSSQLRVPVLNWNFVRPRWSRSTAGRRLVPVVGPATQPTFREKSPGYRGHISSGVRTEKQGTT